MSYIGKTPTSVPLTSSDITDSIISLPKLTDGTDGNLISYDASGNPVAVATGTDGQVLTSTGAGSPPVFETLPAGGSYELLTTTTASNVASFAVNGFFTSDYDVYKIFLYNVYAGTTDQDLRMRVNTTGSYTEQTATSNYFYAFTRLNGTTSSTTNSEDAAQYQSQSGMACGRISNDSSKMSNTEITFFKPTDASNYKIFQSQFGGWNSTTQICTGTSTGVYLNTTAVTGLTFLSQAGNIWCEKLYLYGLKNS
jgi:hypothetical protein